MIAYATESNIIHYILDKYKNLSHPNYLFKYNAESDNLKAVYLQIANYFKSEFNIVDQSDMNYESCYAYVISHEKNEWLLELSLVGPFANLMRSKAKKNCLYSEFKSLNNIEKMIISKLDEYHIMMVKRETLEKSIKMKLNHNDNPNDTRIYHALFADTYGLPWEKAKKLNL
jgi:hypothetical protein